jgi:hypothetical protein
LPRVDPVDNSQVLWTRVVAAAEVLVTRYEHAVGHEKALVRARMQEYRAGTLARLAADVRVPVAPGRLARVVQAVEAADRMLAEALARG